MSSTIAPHTARHLAGLVRRLEPVGVTVPRKILDAVTHAEQRIPELEQQRLEVTSMVGQTGPGFTASISNGDLTADQVLARLIGADLEPAKVTHTYDAALAQLGRSLRDTLKGHGEKWVPALRAVIEERAEEVYNGIYDPDSLDYRRDPKGAEYALRDDATALTWGELNTLWSVAGTFIRLGIIAGNGHRPDVHLFSTPTEERGEKDHLDFTRFIIMCREEHEPSLYTQAEVQAFETEHADHPTTYRPRDRYTAATGITRHY